MGGSSQPARGPNNARHLQGDITATIITTWVSNSPHFSHVFATAIPALPSNLQVFTFESSRHYHTNDRSRNCFSCEGPLRSDNFQMASRWQYKEGAL